MKSIKLIDCTIHEGGYRNNWKFCENEMQLRGLIGELSLIGADVIDIGLIDGKKHIDGSSIYEVLEQIPVKYLDSEREYSATIVDYKNFDIENLKKICKVNYLRLVVSNDNSIERLNLFCKKAKENDYKIIISFEMKPEDSIDEICCFLRQIDSYDILIFDDVFGTFEGKKLIDCFEKVNRILESDIALGLRGRNSRFQIQGIIEILIKLIEKRNFVIEASIFGISRNVSLLELEIEAAWINDKYNGQYNLTRIEKIVDVILKSVQYDMNWKVDRLSPIISDYAVDYSYRDIIKATSITSEELANVLQIMPFDKHKYLDLKISFQKLGDYRKWFYKSKLAVIIWAERASSEMLDVYLRKQIANIAQSKIDVYICNISLTDKYEINEKYMNLKINNLFFIKDRKKVIETIGLLCKNYDYVWMNQPEYIIRFEQIGGILASIIKKRFDILVAENDWMMEGNRGIYIYDDNIDIFRKFFVNMYAVGTVIYSTEFLKKIYLNSSDIENEIIFVEKIFNFIVENPIKCIGCIDEVYDIQNFNHIFGIDYYLDKWTVELKRLMEKLSIYYGKYVDEVMELKDNFWDPFTKQRIINLKINDVFYIANEKEVITKRNLLIAKIPKKLGAFLLEYKDKKIGRVTKGCIKKLKSISCNIKKSFGKYYGIDFEADVCCVVPQEKIPSTLVYGN